MPNARKQPEVVNKKLSNKGGGVLMESKGLKTYIELKDKMSKALTSPLKLIEKLNTKLTNIGYNTGIADAATSANNLGTELAGISTDSLGNNIDVANKLADSTKEAHALNEALIDTATSTNSLGAELAGISADSLGSEIETVVNKVSDAVTKADALGTAIENIAQISIADALDANDELSLMLKKSELLKGELAHQEIIADELNTAYTKAVNILGDTSAEALEIGSALLQATNQANDLGIQIIGVNQAIAAKNDALDEVNNKQSIFNRLVSKSKVLVAGLGADVKKLGVAFAGIMSVRGIQRQFSNWLGMTTARQAIEVPLIVSLRNMGAARDEIESIKQMASDMQNQFAFSDTLFLAGATQLSRVVSDTSHIELLSQSLADMTAGIHGLKATEYDMSKNAQLLGRALQGNYRMLEREGFALSEHQKEILRTGDELARIAVLNDVVARSFGGMAEALTNTPEGKLNRIRNAVANVHLEIGQRLQPAWMKIVSLFYTHLPQVETSIKGIGNAAISTANFFANTVFPVLFGVFRGITTAATWTSETIRNNWSLIQPITWGLVGALTAWAAITAILAIKKTVLAVKTKALTAAQWLLNKAMLANPIGLVIGLIGILVGAIATWITRVGGLKVAWLIAMDTVLTAWEWVQLSFFSGIYKVLNFWDMLKLGMKTAGIAIANYMGDMRTNVLTILQSMVNSAIDIINKFIRALDNLPGVSISTIDQVSFGTKSALRNKAEQKQREKALTAYKDEITATITNRALSHDTRAQNIDLARASRLAALEAARYTETSNADNNKLFDPMSALLGEQLYQLNELAGYGSDTAANTGRMAREINIADEDLRYLRDIAERESINVITSQVIVPQFSVNIGEVKETADIDEIINKFKEEIEAELLSYPQGVHV